MAAIAKRLLMVWLLIIMVGSLGIVNAQEQSAGQDMKDAGHSTKKAAKKTGHDVKKGTKKATHKAAKKTKQGADKVEDKTAPEPK
jgi:hypothetical protein